LLIILIIFILINNITIGSFKYIKIDLNSIFFYFENKMRASIEKLPEEMENEIREYTLTKSVRLRILLDKYPLTKMDIFFSSFTKDQLDRVYRYGCVSKIMIWNDEYTMHVTQPIIHELLKNDEVSFSLFAYSCWPVSGFNNYWETKNKKRQPPKPEYIRRIKKFCTFALAFSQVTQNQKFIDFCENLVYDVLVGSLIMKNV